MRGSVPDPFAGHEAWATESPRPIVPVPASMSGSMRGRRVLIGLPGHGWRADLRADEKVVQGSRTYVPVIPEAEWYRAEAEQTEVFAPLVPLERVWVEDYGVSLGPSGMGDEASLLVSLDEPPRRNPIAALDAKSLTGRRVVEMTSGTDERRDLRAVTELHTSDDGSICVRVTTELEWYRWAWAGKTPRTLEIPANTLWAE
ncbi:hypothetical protein [Actinoplanes sp. NBRC 101535]|uniref:hypothetical protein n=1 Tax=Actinoplanes sp. NBRC 101535 TaxID=3032196 RepID=UPI0024A0707E|nr:hypothetical protein [Actinoplanes sp. NBRC 101535]GLY05235.1 hypothetical protein Acsp01_56140 [Actinoplanes sp. NBRC 101535]